MKKFSFLIIYLFFGLGLKAQIVNIPDANFKAKLLAAAANNEIAMNLQGDYFKIDANSDGEIQETEALTVRKLNLINDQLPEDGISSLSGIGYFTNLTDLDCRYNNLTELDLSGLSNLQNLNLRGNNIAVLPDFSGLTALITLNCSDNIMSSFDAFIPSLVVLNCAYNGLQQLNLTGLPNLQQLDAYMNDLTDFIIPDNNIINKINVDDCWFLSLDLSNCSHLQELDCNVCPLLSSLNIKDGSTLASIGFLECPNLHYICADESDFAAIEAGMENENSNIVFNSYCSFSPGGTTYSVNLKTSFDNDNDGCDEDDPELSQSDLRYSISDGFQDQIVTLDYTQGMVALSGGAYTIIPLLENQAFFNISPQSATIILPEALNPFEQNFCLTPNGNHPDLEISLLPINGARPGFDANYKIIYKNKGTHTQSGSINMSFDDTILDVIDANPDTVGPSPESLVWTFTNLQPFESREIYVIINLNSPVDTPSVNAGDILHYTAAISSSQTDEMPLDNTFTLNQTVVNSFDPNDKTCLEGNTIKPEMIGEYVHYIIRFENTGTANAQNIVVKDMIDTSKFDISSLIPLDGSHPFTTRITDTNKVEFIFENIQLPFDDANNDGYVAFKIKTKPTLVVGNTFSNTANIYFDYNAPIVTNTATTAIQVLGTDDFKFENYLTLYPNPAADVLHIASKETISVTSISIYNTLGQLLMSVSNPSASIDVSGLASENYFVKVISDKGSASAKFIKK